MSGLRVWCEAARRLRACTRLVAITTASVVVMIGYTHSPPLRPGAPAASSREASVAEAMVPGSRSLERLTVKDAGGWGSVIALCGREDK